MDNHKRRPFLKTIVLLLPLFLLALFTIIIKKSGATSTSDYISGVGSVASLYGIIITIYQSLQARNAAEAAEIAVKKKSKEINVFMSFANISRHIEISNAIPAFLAAKQYEAAIIKIEQLKELLVELREYDTLSDNEKNTAHLYVTKLGTDIVSIRKQMGGQNNLEENMVVTHVMNANTYLQEISAKLKKNEL